MNRFFRFFLRAAGWLRKVFDWVEDEMTPERLKLALSLVRTAENMFGDSGLTPKERNDKRRDWALARLEKVGVPEGLARLAIESAVRAIKLRLAA
tara:strand:+ start:9201 stop:9485 length:285 start_codon:yes stop_codon:yes gene_type:complete